MRTSWTDALARAEAFAPFLAGAMARWPALVDRLGVGEGEAALDMARAAGAGLPVEVALRRERDALALVLAIGDLAGAFPLARVTHELSALADRALDAAIRAAIAERVEGATADARDGPCWGATIGGRGHGRISPWRVPCRCRPRC